MRNPDLGKRNMSYVEEIADRYRSRLGRTTILDRMDYVVIAEWEKQGIPLAVVAAAINEICDQRSDDDLAIESVSYFQETVKRNFRAWLQTRD